MSFDFDEELLEFMEQYFDDDDNVDEKLSSEQFIDQFLVFTEKIDLPAARRLRQLAIYLEENLYIEDNFSCWQNIRTVYQRAHELDQTDIEILDSWAITGHFFYIILDDEAHKDIVYRDNKEALMKALKIDDKNGDIFYSLGLNEYSNYNIGAAEALKYFLAAINLDKHHCMARMYVGHCYFDLKDWQSALTYFTGVDQQILYAERPHWRTYLLKELIAACYMELNNYQQAEILFDELLKIYERVDVDEWSYELENPDYLVKYITGGSFDHMLERAKACLERLGIFDYYKDKFKM